MKTTNITTHLAAWAVGRSLDEVEKREKNLRGMVLISWLLCMGVVIIHWIIASLKTGKNANR